MEDSTSRRSPPGEQVLRTTADTQSAALRAAARNAAAAGDLARQRNAFLSASMSAALDTMYGTEETNGTHPTARAMDDALGVATETEADGWTALEDGFRDAETTTAAMYAAAMAALERRGE